VNKRLETRGFDTESSQYYEHLMVSAYNQVTDQRKYLYKTQINQYVLSHYYNIVKNKSETFEKRLLQFFPEIEAIIEELKPIMSKAKTEQALKKTKH